MSGAELGKQMRRGFELSLCWFCSHLLQRQLFVGPEQKKMFVERKEKEIESTMGLSSPKPS